MNWRTPAGEATAMPFATADEIVTAAIAAAEVAFDPHPDAHDAAVRRATALLRCLRDTSDAGPPLARALRRWRLDDTATRLALLLVAAELSPRVLARAAIDTARPGVTVEAAARSFGVDARGMAAIVRALAPGQPLADLALVMLRGADLPLPRRVLAIAPRVLDIALGAATLDLTTGAHLVAPTAAGATPGDHHAARVRAVGRGAIGLVRGGRAGLPVLARLAEDDGRALLAVELSLLADEPRMRAIARDAVFLDAAVAIAVDVAPRELARAARAVDRLAVHAPVFVVASAGEPAPPFASGAIELELPEPEPAHVRAAVAASFAGVLGAAEVDEVAATAARDLGAIGRAAAAVRAGELPLSRVDAVRRAIAEQLVPLDGGLPRLPTELPPLADALAASIDDVVDRWRAGAVRLRVLITGRAGSGKTTAAAHLAARLGDPAFVVDVPRALRGPDHDPQLAAVVAAVAVGGAILVVENAELIGRRPGRAAGEPTLPLPWLSRCAGLVVITTSDSPSGTETPVKREIDLVIAVPPAGEPERAAMWAWHARRRGWKLDAPVLAALAKAALGPAQIEWVVSYARLDQLLAEVERRSVLVGGRTGAEIY
jgi:Winged helix domain, variant